MDTSSKPNEQVSKQLKGGAHQHQHQHPHQHHNGGGGCDLDDDMDDESPMMSLPKEVMRRVNALKNIQLKMVDVETKFYEELHMLECKYAKLYEDFYTQREKIVNGEHEPSDEEAKFVLDAVDELSQDVKDKAKIDEATENKEGEAGEHSPVKGIPDFWLHAMKSTDILGSAIQEHDEPILQHLNDIRVRMKADKPYGYTIEFHFDDNEYFTNKVLTKTYELTTDKDERDPFGYDGPALYKSIGCKIDWNKGKDVTTKIVKKRQKHKSTGTIRVVSKEEKQDSFFNFFESPTPDGIRPSYKAISAPSQFPKKEHGTDGEAADDGDEMNEEDEELYEADFEIGHFLKEFLIPKAVLYYTGELIDEANYEDEDEYDDEGGADHDDDENPGDEDDEGDDDDDDGLDDERKGNRKNAKKQSQQQPQGKSKSPKP